MPKAFSRRCAVSVLSKRRPKRPAAKPRQTRSAAGQSSASIRRNSRPPIPEKFEGKLQCFPCFFVPARLARPAGVAADLLRNVTDHHRPEQSRCEPQSTYGEASFEDSLLLLLALLAAAAAFDHHLLLAP